MRSSIRFICPFASLTISHTIVHCSIEIHVSHDPLKPGDEAHIPQLSLCSTHHAPNDDYAFLSMAGPLLCQQRYDCNPFPPHPRFSGTRYRFGTLDTVFSVHSCCDSSLLHSSKHSRRLVTCAFLLVGIRWLMGRYTGLLALHRRRTIQQCCHRRAVCKCWPGKRLHGPQHPRQRRPGMVGNVCNGSGRVRPAPVTERSTLARHRQERLE